MATHSWEMWYDIFHRPVYIVAGRHVAMGASSLYDNLFYDNISRRFEARELCSNLIDRSDYWHAHSSTAALVCQISEQCYHFKTQFFVFGYYDKSSDRLLEQPLGPLNQVTRYFEAGRPVQWYRNTLVVEWYIATSFPSTKTWGVWCQKQVSQTVISNFIPQYSVDWNYVSMPEIPASGTKVLAFSRRSKLIISILCYIESLVTIFMPSYGKEIH